MSYESEEERQVQEIATGFDVTMAMKKVGKGNALGQNHVGSYGSILRRVLSRNGLQRCLESGGICMAHVY
jgi:hypothetical protein